MPVMVLMLDMPVLSFTYQCLLSGLRIYASVPLTATCRDVNVRFIFSLLMVGDFVKTRHVVVIVMTQKRNALPMKGENTPVIKVDYLLKGVCFPGNEPPGIVYKTQSAKTIVRFARKFCVLFMTLLCVN